MEWIESKPGVLDLVDSDATGAVLTRPNSATGLLGPGPGPARPTRCVRVERVPTEDLRRAALLSLRRRSSVGGLGWAGPPQRNVNWIAGGASALPVAEGWISESRPGSRLCGTSRPAGGPEPGSCGAGNQAPLAVVLNAASWIRPDSGPRPGRDRAGIDPGSHGASLFDMGLGSGSSESLASLVDADLTRKTPFPHEAEARTAQAGVRGRSNSNAQDGLASKAQEAAGRAAECGAVSEAQGGGAACSRPHDSEGGANSRAHEAAASKARRGRAALQAMWGGDGV